MPGSAHLTGVEPVLQPRFVLDAWQQQPVHHVLTNGGQDGQTKSNAQQHEESREVFDAHLQRLWQNRKRKVTNGRLHLVPCLSLLDAHRFLLDPRRAGDHSSVRSAGVTILHFAGDPASTEGCCTAQFLRLLLTYGAAV